MLGPPNTRRYAGPLYFALYLIVPLLLYQYASSRLQYKWQNFAVTYIPMYRNRCVHYCLPLRIEENRAGTPHIIIRLLQI